MIGRTLRRLILIFLIACLAAKFSLAAARSDDINNRVFVIRNARIFDGEKIISTNSVAVVDGKIAAVGNDIATPPSAQIIDATGDTLLPGLIDSHVHIWLRDLLRMGLVTGVTTELDMYMRWEEAQRWKEEESRGAYDIADFRSAGTAIAVTGGHGTEAFLPPLTPIRTADQAQAFVDERIAHGSDYIKVMYDNGPRFATMPKAVLEAIVKAAHKRGKMVIVHTYSAQGFLDVINAGSDGLAHVPIVKLPEPEFIQALKSHHVFAITTLQFTDFHFGKERLASKLPNDPFLASYLGPFQRSALEQPAWDSPEHISFADNQAALRTLRDVDIPLLAGTDSSNSADSPPGVLMHTELQLMVNAGLPPSEALADATSVPAKVFGLSDRGRIAPGLRADLLLVRGDPTRDIGASRDIVAIWKQGVRVDGEGFRDEVARQNEAWRFGAGWMPVASPPSTLAVSTNDGGPDQARSTMVLSGEVKPRRGLLYAGAQYLPSSAYPGATGDISGISRITFLARGDGETYTISLYPANGTPTTKYFVAAEKWTLVSFQFSDFGSDGKNIALVQIASATPGPFRLELANAHIGAHRWLGVAIGNQPNVARIDAVDKDSPAARAGLRPGDLIAVFNGKPLRKPEDVRLRLAETHINDRVPIEIERDGKRLEVTIKVAERPG